MIDGNVEQEVLSRQQGRLVRIRRIKKGDCAKDFETGEPRFDLDQRGRKLNLLFYFLRDRSGKYECYVLENGEDILGVLCIQDQEEHLYLSRIGVRKGHSGKGYGTRMLVESLQKAQGLNKRKIACKSHKKAWGFFESMGFRKMAEFNDRHWGMSALMELRIDYSMAGSRDR